MYCTLVVGARIVPGLFQNGPQIEDISRDKKRKEIGLIHCSLFDSRLFGNVHAPVGSEI